MSGNDAMVGLRPDGLPTHAGTSVADPIVDAEAALRLSEEKFSKAFHASPDGITISLLEDNRFLEVNDGFLEIIGYTREEVIGKTPFDLNVWADPTARGQLIRGLQEHGHVRGVRIVYNHREGWQGICEMSASTINVGGKPGFLAVGRDITARVRAEEEKQRAFEEIAQLKEALERERDYLREEVNHTFRLGEIVGHSPALGRVLSQTEAVAGTKASVLILGESGVGKELLARAIHDHSPRRDKPLVKVNCASIPRDLFESEFFGHVRGAFTGAHRDRVGRFELADGGTLFLDEVAEIPLELQGKLLRMVQEAEFERVGEERTRRADVRIIAATNRNLRAEVEQGRFREDLFYRLSVFPIQVPPLRERREDILPLANHFITLACRDQDRELLTLTRSQADALLAYDWPGNVREMRNVIERAVIMAYGKRLRFDPPVIQADADCDLDLPACADAPAPSAFLTAAEFRQRERANIVRALEQARWKVSGPGGAAEMLGLKPTTLGYRMKALGIQKP
jgi:PAS domain S-box-containing protein